jgi:hypothetical protein
MSISVVKIPGNFSEKLRSAKPITLYKPAKPGEFRGPPTGITIPPLNTDIRFSRALAVQKLPKVFKAEKVPDQWDWVNEYPIDDVCTIEKKKRITKVPNQGNCGSCWAVSTADAVSDCFVVAGYPNPKCSSAYILNCFGPPKQAGCEGGNPGVLILDIEKDGITSDSCIDYSFCTKQSCTQPWGECGCYDPNGNHNLYFITNPKLYAVVDGETEKDKQVVNTIKSHILNKGPIVAGFLVFQNFTDGEGKYLQTKGVYLENVDYSTTEQDKYIDMRFAQNVGGHAVVVVGWGVEKDVKIGPNKVADVPYWLCRNSWSTQWGQNGYWKHAMFPFNEFSAFEQGVVIEDDVSSMLGGGLLAFSIGEIKPDNKLEKASVPSGAELREELQFYKGDPPMQQLECAEGEGGGITGGGRETEEEKKKKKRNMNIMLIIGLILLVLIVILVIFSRK